MTQQPGVPDTNDVTTSMRSHKQKRVFVLHRDQWYLVDSDTTMSPRTICLFDGVIFVNSNGNYEVAKDRYDKLTSSTLNELKFDLFIDGKAFEELPKFRFDAGKFPNGPVNLHKEENGDLVAMSALNENYEQTN